VALQPCAVGGTALCELWPCTVRTLRRISAAIGWIVVMSSVKRKSGVSSTVGSSARVRA
jgi:hypothetical protein